MFMSTDGMCEPAGATLTCHFHTSQVNMAVCPTTGLLVLAIIYKSTRFYATSETQQSCSKFVCTVRLKEVQEIKKGRNPTLHIKNPKRERGCSDHGSITLLSSNGNQKRGGGARKQLAGGGVCALDHSMSPWGWLWCKNGSCWFIYSDKCSDCK